MGIKNYFLIAFLFFFTPPALAQGPACLSLFLNEQSVATTAARYHNAEIKKIQSQGITLESVDLLLQKLLEENTLAIPLDSSGLAAAANVGMHHGGYGLFIWHRDFARVWQGLAALPALLKNRILKDSTDGFLKSKEAAAEKDIRDSSKALLKLIEDPQWRQAALENIANPQLHVDPSGGFKVVIWIRRLLTPFRENRAATEEELLLESQWGHKQNDALATLAESVLDAVKTERLSLHDFSTTARENLLLLAAYFVRVKYASMEDVGAWEENMALRTSSVGLVASFLNRVQKGLAITPPRTPEDYFFHALREETLAEFTGITPELRAIIQESLSPASLSASVEEGTRLVRERIAGRVTESSTAPVRFEDSALYHLLWSEASVLSVNEKLKLIEGLKILERPSGQIRYEQDWFLSADVFRFQEALGLKDKLLIPDGQGGYKVASAEEVLNIVNLHEAQRFDKDMSKVIEATGPGLEAQWTLPDSYLVQFFADLYLKTRDPAFLQKAKDHYARISALITGPGEINSEGHPVAPWRLPEAYLPARVLVDGQLQLHYFVSPNSPLNWSTAEFIKATQKLRMALEAAKD